MSDLSEEAWCAGWMPDLEYHLWAVILDAREIHSFMTLTAEERGKLAELATACGGWIVFDDVNAETWIALPAWEKHFAAWRSTQSEHPDDDRQF